MAEPMRAHGWSRHSLALSSAAALLGVAALAALAQPASAASGTSSWIVCTAAGPGLSISAVGQVGGAVTQILSAAGGVEASLTASEVIALRALPGVTLTPDVAVEIASTPARPSAVPAAGSAPADVFPEQSGATALWAKGDTGAGINVAVLDTGVDPLPDFGSRILPGVDLTGAGNPELDAYGHGTFVAGLIAGDGASSNGLDEGEAPGAGLVPVKVAGASGQTDLATVIAGIGWVIAHHLSENIGVLNLSLGYVPLTSTALDPLDQAVQAAWNAGIVVVASAGNDGPDNGTILSPGDDPLVITVGSIADGGSLSPSGDTMSSFSSVGPTTPDGWFKPDLVASGQSVVSLRAPGSTVDTSNPSARVGSAGFLGTGTSFSTAIVSGAAALLLAAHPGLSPDQVKADLLGTASRGPVGDPFVDGHGVLNVAAAAAAPAALSLRQPPAPVSPIGVADSLGAMPPAPLTVSWLASSWNLANWTEVPAAAPPASSPGSPSTPSGSTSWTGSTWNGSAWTGSAWTGSAWTGSAWTGSAWTGSAWTGSAWTGSAWSGSAWS
jgi:serine protease AprX